MPLRRAIRVTILAAAFAAAGFCRPVAAAGQEDDLPIYKMVRSLENIQDKIVGGDIAAVDMQRFMLEAIDKRLRASTSADFDDLRNVDAALTYAMSGGNPATLDYLISQDVRGNFDNRVTSALLLYMDGKGSMAEKTLDETAPEYKKTAIGPYLALVAANAVMNKKPEKALEYFDWARLILPGTIVEEAALRRSLMITIKTDDLEKSKDLARRYLTRFPKSPYAAQVADLFVTLVNDRHEEITEPQVAAILELMEPKRKQEVYLRIARKAAVTGKLDFAKWAARQAMVLDDGSNPNQMRLARLYLGLSDLPTADLEKSKDVFYDIPDEMLGPKERRLRDAGAFVLSELEKKPTLESLTQADGANPDAAGKPQGHASDGGGQGAGHGVDPGGTQLKSQAAADAKIADAKTADAVDTFVSQSKEQLRAIDEMIKKGDM